LNVSADAGVGLFKASCFGDACHIVTGFELMASSANNATIAKISITAKPIGMNMIVFDVAGEEFGCADLTSPIGYPPCLQFYFVRKVPPHAAVLALFDSDVTSVPISCEMYCSTAVLLSPNTRAPMAARDCDCAV
jgi:hypothetical protein